MPWIIPHGQDGRLQLDQVSRKSVGGDGVDPDHIPDLFVRNLRNGGNLHYANLGGEVLSLLFL